MKQILFLLFLIVLNQKALAFPEMIRHHYVNCSACHVSNSGGGLLNAYGRTISHELLSTWGGPKEARPFYFIDAEKIPWLNVGGDVRGLQVNQENATVKRGRFFWMEGNIQAAATLGALTGYVSFGQVAQANQSLKLLAARYYASYQFSDEFSLRAGRYIPVYGLTIPQHNFLVKQNLSLAPGSERDAADIQWNGESFSWAAGVSKSLLDSDIRDEENALNLQAQYVIQDKHKIGVSYWYGEATKYRKVMLGAHAVLGWTEKFYTLFEIDHVWSKDTSSFIETKSLYQVLKVAYEIHKGIHLQSVQEWGKSDTTSASEIQSLGVGAIWYPRPHFEFDGLWSKRRVLAQTDIFEDYAYLLLHYYF